MDRLSLTLGTSLTLCGVLCISLSLPLLYRKIKRNSFYGVRIRQSMESDEAWLAINHFWAKRMIAWGIPLICLGVVTFFVPFKQHVWLTWLPAVAILVAVAVPGVQSIRYARREWP